MSIAAFQIAQVEDFIAALVGREPSPVNLAVAVGGVPRRWRLVSIGGDGMVYVGEGASLYEAMEAMREGTKAP